ncbi:MAG: hypothetical protein ACKO8U_02510, partial [Pirellula sp.]
LVNAVNAVKKPAPSGGVSTAHRTTSADGGRMGLGGLATGSRSAYTHRRFESLLITQSRHTQILPCQFDSAIS